MPLAYTAITDSSGVTRLVDPTGTVVQHPSTDNALTPLITNTVPNDYVNTLSPPVQNVLPVGSQPVNVPSPGTNTMQTTVAVPTGETNTGLVGWAKANPVAAAGIAFLAIWLGTKYIK